MTEQTSNFGQSALSGTMTASSLSLSVVSASSFASSGNFRIVVTALSSGLPVNAEIMMVTGVSGNTFTVSRAQESTTAQIHSSGEVVANVLTSGLMQQILNGGSSGGSSVITNLAVTAVSSSNSSLIMPSRSYIANIVIQETAGHAITGGLNIGTSSNGSQIFSGLSVGANSLQSINAGSLAQTIFSVSSTQTIYLNAASSWNGASINVTLAYGIF